MSKGLRHTVALIGALLIAFFVVSRLTGCWDDPEYPDHPPRVEGGPTSADQPFYETMNEFTFRLARELDFEGNTLVSPLSLYQNLALLLNGAEGDTKTALEGVLGISDVARQDLNDAQNRLINRYRKMDDRPVRLANGIFFVWPIVLEKGAVKGYEEWYNADIVKLGSAGVGAVRSVNRWAEEKTDGMIPEIIDTLDKTQIMLVLNALAFDAEWDSPFDDKRTKNSDFHTPAGDVRLRHCHCKKSEPRLQQGTWAEVGRTHTHDGDAMGFDPIGEQQGTVRIGEMAVHPRQVWNVTVGEFEVDVDHLARCTGDQGGFSVDRGVEELIAAATEPALMELGAAIVFMGYGRLEGLLEEAVREHPGRIYLLPAVRPDDLLPWTASADVCFVGQPPRTLNQRMNLPNKLFESIMAGVPVVVSSGNEQCRLTSAEGVGVCVDVDDPAAIAAACAELLAAASAEQHNLRAHCRTVALAKYTWDQTAVGLLELYRKLAREGATA